MSSSTGLGRTRSLRKPASRGSELGQKESTTTRNEARVVSPSRLPVMPPPRSTAPSSSSTASRRAASSTTGRLASGLFSSKLSTRAGDNATSATTRPFGRAASTRQAPPSTTTSTVPLSRTASTTRPRSSGGPSSTAAPRERPLGHSRAKSTVTSLTAATTLRPLSHLSTTSSTSTPTSATSTKPQTRSQTHARTQSQSATQTQPQPPPSPKHQSAFGARGHRPAFNLNQQHYSPAKTHAPKPLTSTFLAPPSPSKLPTNVAISAETSRLQAELLQLSLLHRDAGAVDAEWHASARHKLGARFKRLARDEEGVRALEREGVEARGLGALVRWGGGGDDGRGGGKNTRGMGLDEKVQILDQVLTGVWTLSEPEGRYQRTGRAFEIWANRMAAILDAQRSGDIDALVQGDEVLFLSELDKTWKRDCAGLVRKLDSWRRALRELGDVEEAGDGQQQQQRSGLARAVGGCRSLVHDMLAELSVMEQIELDATRAEDEWIERMNTELTHDDTQREDVPLWKLLI